MDHNRDCHVCGECSHSIWDEVICHVPFTCFALSIAFALLGIMHFFGLASMADDSVLSCGYGILFHLFHYLHILIAVAGSVATYFRFVSLKTGAVRKLILGVVVALIAPTVFCVCSDILLPSLAGRLLGMQVCMHVCFLHPHDALNLGAFMFMGLLSGLAMLARGESLRIFSFFSHFGHILASSLAAVFYLAAHECNFWFSSMGILLFFLFFAVVIPCTMSDIVVPMYCAHRSGEQK